jgi:hypothetical protein
MSHVRVEDAISKHYGRKPEGKSQLWTTQLKMGAAGR